MKNLKIFILLSVALITTTTFAAWSQPTATPPNGNTQPPINVGTDTQYKKGTIGAYEFCLYKSDGTKITPCIGKSSGGTSSFPWVFDGTTNNIKNTNVGGKVMVDGQLCVGTPLGTKCIDDWTDISSYITTSSGTVKGSGSVNKIAKWTNPIESGKSQTLTDSLLSETGSTVCLGGVCIPDFNGAGLWENSSINNWIRPKSSKGVYAENGLKVKVVAPNTYTPSQDGEIWLEQ